MAAATATIIPDLNFIEGTAVFAEPRSCWAWDLQPSFSGLAGSRACGQRHAIAWAVPDLEITADAQLHNRRDLIEALGREYQRAFSGPDAELILASYEKWGENCPDFLLGEFAFVIRDDRRGVLFCCRDHIGHRPLFFSHSQQSFSFASSISALLSRTAVRPRLNRRKLFAKGLALDHTPDEETLHEGVFSLPSGSSLVVHKTRMLRRKYWEPAIRTGLVPRSHNDVFPALRALLFEAVECRLERSESAASLLSGGLDSSSMVAIAASLLAKKNRTLLALSCVLPDESAPGLLDESAYIADFGAWSNVRIERVTASGHGPFDLIDDPGRFHEGWPSSRQYLLDALGKSATAHGADLVLEGDGGELGPTSHGHRHYVDLAFHLRWTTLFNELRKRRAIENISPVRLFGSQLLDFLGPERGRRPTLILAADFLRQYRIPKTHRSFSPDHRRYAQHVLKRWVGRHAERPVHTMLGQARAAFPMRDKRLLEFCLAVPGELKVRDGYTRYLIRGALNGLLPPRIQWRTTKRPFASDYFVRYNSQLGVARRFVAEISGSDPVREVVDVDQLFDLVKRPVHPVKGSFDALIRVPATIYLICFLRQFADFRS